ncbi:MAG: hypothetical protein EA359_05790 [Balneolaceae bacterium]|nr:MAG: hypothetical protein EA359_05790 [Balneolaceae bacterium]
MKRPKDLQALGGREGERERGRVNLKAPTGSVCVEAISDEGCGSRITDRRSQSWGMRGMRPNYVTHYVLTSRFKKTSLDKDAGYWILDSVSIPGLT